MFLSPVEKTGGLAEPLWTWNGTIEMVTVSLQVHQLAEVHTLSVFAMEAVIPPRCLISLRMSLVSLIPQDAYHPSNPLPPRLHHLRLFLPARA
jgi:hypothetical protein